MGILGAISCLASVIGAPFGSLLSLHFGWRGGLVGFALLAAVGLAIVFIALDSEITASSRAPAPPELSGRAHSGESALRLPRVWCVALLSGLVGMPAFGATFFAPSAARMNFHLDAVSTAWIISLGYLLGIAVSLVVGILMDRMNRWVVMAGLVACIVPCALLMNDSSLGVFEISTAMVVALSFTAVNQSYGLASDVAVRSQMGNVMGILSLGAGLTGYAGPQLLGILRDRTHSFHAGWTTLAAIAVVSCIDVIFLGATARRTFPAGNQISAIPKEG